MATGATETGGPSTAAELIRGDPDDARRDASTLPKKNKNIMPRSEEGSSSNTNGNGDLALKIKKMFESSQEQFPIGKGRFTTGCLISVPNHLRKLDEQAFTPLLISIGPIHRSNAKLQTMEKCKVQFCECFIKRANIDLGALVLLIKAREKEIRSYYAKTIESKISSDDFVTMIVLDGLFILEYFLRQSNPCLVENDPMIAEWMPPILKFDLVLLENQLPFFVLEMLFNQATFPAELMLEPLSLREHAFAFFKYYKFQKLDFLVLDAKIEHFTDLVRLFYLSEQLPDRRSVGPNERSLDRRSEGPKLSYSATQLHEAGVKFEEATKHSGSNGCFLDIRFDPKSGVLKIPFIKLNHENIRLIRNIIALEQSLYVGHAYVTDFFVILDFLINTSKDVDLLCDKGILDNYLGDSDAAASAINNLNTNILWDYMNHDYSDLCVNLNAFYKKRWHKWKATLWHQYFSTPWRATSTSAAIILLLLTLAQTVCSLKSTIW